MGFGLQSRIFRRHQNPDVSTRRAAPWLVLERWQEIVRTELQVWKERRLNLIGTGRCLRKSKPFSDKPTDLDASRVGIYDPVLADAVGREQP